MIKIRSNIVVRNCLDRSFLINIENNKIIYLSSEAMKFLQQEIELGLMIKHDDENNPGFYNMVGELVKEGFLKEE